MLRLSILVLLCLSGVFSTAVEKEPVEEKAETEKTKRYASHPTPCPLVHPHPWQPEPKIIVKPQPSGWQPQSTGWQPQSTGWQQPKWQPQPSGWHQQKIELTGYQQPKLSHQTGWQQPKLSHQTGWQQPQKWQPQSTGWHQPKWQPQPSVWPEQKWQPQPSVWPEQKWQPQPSVWPEQKWQPKPSGWHQQKLDLTGYQQPKLSPQKPIFAYASRYSHPMVHQPWAPVSKPLCPSPCPPSHGTIQYAPPPQVHPIKIPQIHPPVYLPPPSHNNVWKEPCD